jgi:hypothetical protein
MFGSTEIRRLCIKIITIYTIIGAKSIPLKEDGIKRRTVSYNGNVIACMNFGRKCIPMRDPQENITSRKIIQVIRSRKVRREKRNKVIKKMLLEIEIYSTKKMKKSIFSF